MLGHDQRPRHLVLALPLLLSTFLAACGELPEEGVEGTESALTIPVTVSARVRANLGYTFDPGCCGASWTTTPSTIARWDAINEATCNNSTDYISAPVLGTSPAWAAASFDVDLSGIPIGKAITNVRFSFCARPTLPVTPGYIAAKAIYWDSATNPPGNRYTATDQGDNIVIPGSLFPSFQSYAAVTKATTNPGPSKTGKTSTSRMRLNLFGDAVSVSMVDVQLTYLVDLF